MNIVLFAMLRACSQLMRRFDIPIIPFIMRRRPIIASRIFPRSLAPRFFVRIFLPNIINAMPSPAGMPPTKSEKSMPSPLIFPLSAEKAREMNPTITPAAIKSIPRMSKSALAPYLIGVPALLDVVWLTMVGCELLLIG